MHTPDTDRLAATIVDARRRADNYHAGTNPDAAARVRRRADAMIDAWTVVTGADEWGTGALDVAAARHRARVDETDGTMSRTYAAGLVVVVQVWDDGTVTYVPDTSEASAAILEHIETDDPRRDVAERDSELVAIDNRRR